MNIIITKNKKNYNWKNIHKSIVKNTIYENYGDYEENVPDLTLYYCYNKDTKKPIGYISLGYTTEYHRFFGIEFVGVLPKYRHKNIGTKLISFAKRIAKKAGNKRIFVVFSSEEKRMESFNKKQGFIFENKYVNTKLNDGKTFDFCPVSYYNNYLKHKSKVVHSFDIMYFIL